MKPYKIPREALKIIAFNADPDVTIQDLTLWLQSKTYNQFTVIESEYLKELLKHFKNSKELMIKLEENHYSLISTINH